MNEDMVNNGRDLFEEQLLSKDFECEAANNSEFY